MIRVGFIVGEPSPWRVSLLEKVAEHRAIDLTVIYAAPTVHRRTWNVNLPREATILRGPSLPLTRLLHHDYPLTPQIWPLLEREQFDVLVIGGWSLLATQLAIVWARRRKVPYLVISENHFREKRPLWIKAVKSIVLRHVIPQAAGQLVTGTLAREHALHYGARADRITVFPNAIDVDEYGRAADRLRARAGAIRQSLGIAEDAVVFAQVARLLPQKAPDEALEAVARARALTPRPVHLLLVGEGTLRPALEQRSAELAIAVTFAGFRQGEELLECYAAADVFMLLSRREPWGVVVNEAAAFGLPLMLTDAVGASADLLRAGENGELVHSGDVDGQARAIARLTNDELRARYGSRSRELVEPWGFGPSIESFVSAVETAARRA